MLFCTLVPCGHFNSEDCSNCELILKTVEKAPVALMVMFLGLNFHREVFFFSVHNEQVICKYYYFILRVLDLYSPFLHRFVGTFCLFNMKYSYIVPTAGTK